jgi:hypothetical protein
MLCDRLLRTSSVLEPAVTLESAWSLKKWRRRPASERIYSLRSPCTANYSPFSYQTRTAKAVPSRAKLAEQSKVLNNSIVSILAERNQIPTSTEISRIKVSHSKVPRSEWRCRIFIDRKYCSIDSGYAFAYPTTKKQSKNLASSISQV